jgi:hypothetical protein
MKKVLAYRCPDFEDLKPFLREACMHLNQNLAMKLDDILVSSGLEPAAIARSGTGYCCRFQRPSQSGSTRLGASVVR